MSLQERFLANLVARGVARCLTGRPRDLALLLALARVPIPNPGLSAFLSRLSRDLQDGSGLANLLLHVGRHANRRCKQRLIENIFFNWIVRGGRLRTGLRARGHWPPFFVVISPTMRCNLECTGCYAGLYRKDGELAEVEVDRLLDECKAMGAYFVVFSGGEPYLLRDSLLRLFRKHRDMFFLTFTNGTLLDEGLVAELARLGNVAPALSLEGYGEETDGRRGAGVYAKVTSAMERLRAHGVIFGISVTYTRQNVDVVTDTRFVEHYANEGAVFAWYFMFMPVGAEPMLDLVPTPEQRVRCGERVAELRRHHPVFLADFWNDGPAIGGCMAGGRRYLHVLNSGRVEPCVFAHFGVDNIRDTTLLEAANSPFFRAIRQAFPYNASANLKRPCLIMDHPSVLRRVVEQHVVAQGHPHAEDLLRDRTVMQWVDAYAERLEQLTEPAWQQTIHSPESRWYREKPEYGNLFRFGRPTDAASPSVPVPKGSGRTPAPA